MPEGPSIVILKDQAAVFQGKRISVAEGNASIDKTRIPGQTIKAFRSWGKHFLIEFADFSIRVHLLMFGSYLINERKNTAPRLHLEFAEGGELNFYACSVRYIEASLDDVYDWSVDVMREEWNPQAAKNKLLAKPNTFVCDALLDQDIFAGVGNIIKNEVLFRIGVHPLSTIGAMPTALLQALIMQARQYSFEFLAWKRAFVLKKHWLVHTKTLCPRCQVPLTRRHLGKTHRRSFFCEKCQKLYA